MREATPFEYEAERSVIAEAFWETITVLQSMAGLFARKSEGVSENRKVIWLQRVGETTESMRSKESVEVK